jgi:hypothetical protein
MEQKTALNSRPPQPRGSDEACYQELFKVMLYAYEQLEMDLEMPLHTPTEEQEITSCL